MKYSSCSHDILEFVSAVVLWVTDKSNVRCHRTRNLMTLIHFNLMYMVIIYTKLKKILSSACIFAQLKGRVFHPVCAKCA